MPYIADLHIHSRYSLATSRSLTLPALAAWAMRKGIGVLASGDFTHPAWLGELKDGLEQDEKSGLYRLKIPPMAMPGIHPAARPPLFCLQAEISSIYKSLGKTRKIHNLVYMPDFRSAEMFSARLERFGRLTGDGRPTVSLDSRDLLEMVLETDPRAVLVPAHIWTPWFGLFGSRSGFDKLEDCYRDLSEHIFALETGLSSDPDMNRLLSALDGYALLSNSDAHSGRNLGREANLFSGSPDYDRLFDALRSQSKRKAPDTDSGFMGTLEFFPQEGKYYLDGHRACALSLNPAESRLLKNICPVCGSPLTIGVLNRIMSLADRAAKPELPLEPPLRRHIPLCEIVAQILGLKPQSKKVIEKCDFLTASLAPELEITALLPLDAIKNFWEPLGEAIARVRSNRLELNPGYDGQYGTIRIFGAGEL